METFWISIAIVLILGAMAIAITILVMRIRSDEKSDFEGIQSWHVELWSICYGYQVDFRFTNTCIIGRMSLYEHATGRVPKELDTTVSREHCLLYEQDGLLLAWNMSAVNPTAINGLRLYQPVQLMPGDRIELGNSVYLVTRVERI